MRLSSLALTGIALFLAAPSFGQVALPAAAPSQDLLIQNLKPKSELPVSVKDKTDKKVRELLDKQKASLELKGSKPEEALLTLLKQLDSDYHFDTAFYPLGGTEIDLPERGLNLKLTNASGAKALDALTQAIGIGWWAEKENEKVMVHIVKLRETMGHFEMLERMGINVKELVAPAIAVAADASRYAGFAELASLDALGGGLSSKKVSINATTPREVRSLIEELCKQGEVIFAIDSDVPSSSKALAFENVSLRTALEVLCSTAKLSMSVSNRGEKTTIQFSRLVETDKKKED